MRAEIALVCFLSSMALGQFKLSIRQEGDTMKLTFASPIKPKIMLSAPYSCLQTDTQVQTVAGGTQISQPPTVQKIWRDSQGRIRTEKQFSLPARPPGRWRFALVEIDDPVSGFAYALDDQNKVAHRAMMAGRPALQAVSSAQGASRKSDGEQTSSEKLGSRNIEGVTVDGTRDTTVIPAGAEGNDQPIVITYENWFSPELKVLVLSTYSHPNIGVSTVRLTNINRAEPDASVFKPPSGYAVVDEQDSFAITLKRR